MPGYPILLSHSCDSNGWFPRFATAFNPIGAAAHQCKANIVLGISSQRKNSSMLSTVDFVIDFANLMGLIAVFQPFMLLIHRNYV